MRNFIAFYSLINLLAGQMVSAYAATAADGSAKESGSKAVSLPREQPEAAPIAQWADATLPPRLVLLCIHGLGLHKGSYESFGKAMSQYGIITVAIDVRGFGAWLKSGQHTTIDLDGSLADIKAALEQLHKEHPGLPIVILGESMGGAIALRATALYPDLVDGLISSVPAGDRFNELGQNAKVGMRIITGGMNKPLNIGSTIVRQATQKSDLRQTWSNDPMGKMELTPAELLRFQKFMSDNYEAARMIKSAPVLFIQGTKDKLVRPAATWKLCDSLATPNHQLVLSKTGEHLIFEDNQFSDQDLLFVRTWIHKNVTPLAATAVASGKQEPAVLAGSGTSTANSTISNTLPSGGSPPTEQKPTAAADTLRTASATTTGALTGTTQGISYWIELYRGGKTFRCNNKTEFQSGDAIRFHITLEYSSYAYVVMKESSRGKSAVLFPGEQTGENNYFLVGKDYALPSASWLKFDEHPGVEKISLVFARERIDCTAAISGRYITAYVSDDASGSKDLVPTRMQLSWGDPTPVIIPDDAQGERTQKQAGLVKVTSSGPESVLAVDVALSHK